MLVSDDNHLGEIIPTYYISHTCSCENLILAEIHY